jgi:hypothetical protein
MPLNQLAPSSETKELKVSLDLDFVASICEAKVVIYLMTFIRPLKLLRKINCSKFFALNTGNM